MTPFLITGKQRDLLLKTVALVFSLSFSAIAWVAVIAALTGTPWVNPFNNTAILGINEVYANPYRLNILDIHPNISAIFFYTSLSLLFYLLFAFKKTWLRIAFIIPAAGLYLAICMTGSISSIVVTGGILGMVAYALVLHSQKIQKFRTPIATVALLAVIAVVVSTYPLIIRWSATSTRPC